MKEIIVKITADTTTAVKNINDLGQAISKMESELSSTDIGSAEFTRLSGEIMKAKAAQDKLTGSTIAFTEKSVAMGDNIEKVGTGIAGAFAVATGVVGAFGDSLGFSAEEVANAQAKAQSYISILTGLKPVLEGVKSAQVVLNAIMAANPIGIIVVAIGLLIAGFIAFQEPILDFISNWENLRLILLALLGPIGWIIIAYKKLFSAEALAEDERDKAAAAEKARAAERREQLKEKIQAIKKERDAKIEAADKTIRALELEKDTIEAQGKMSDAVTVKILEAELEKTTAVLDANSRMLQSSIDHYKNEALLSGQSEEEFKKSMRSRGMDLDAWQKQANDIIAENQYNVQLAENDITKFKREASEKRAGIAKANADKENAISDAARAKAEAAYQAELKKLYALQAIKNTLLDEIIAAENLYEDSKLTAQEREINSVGDKYFRLIELANQFNIDSTQLEEARLAELKVIEDKYTAEAAARDAKIREDKIKSDEEERLAEIQKWTDKAIIAEQYTQAVSDLATTVFDLTNSYGERDDAAKLKRAKRQFLINKALQLSGAVIDGFKAITASLAVAPLVIGVIPNPVGIANLVATAAATAANITKISATKFEGGGGAPTVPSSSAGGASAVSGSGGSTNTPSFSLFGKGNDLNTTGPGGPVQINKTMIQAFVSETDFASTTNRLALIKANSEL